MNANNLIANNITLAPTLLPGQDLAWLNNQRAAAMCALQQTGLPHNRMETWRYSHCASLEQQATFSAPLITARSNPNAITALLDHYRLEDCWSIVFVDGCFDSSLSRLANLPDGVIATGLAQSLLLDGASDSIQRLGNTLQADDHGWIQLNTARFTDGLFFQLQAGQKLTQALQFIHIRTTADTLINLRHHLLLGKDSHAQLISTWIELEAQSGLINSVAEISLDDSAHLALFQLQLEGEKSSQISHHSVKTAESARFDHHAILLGGNVLRNEIRVGLAGHAECNLSGLFLTQARQQFDNLLEIRHSGSHASSRVQYHGMADARSRGIFQGKIIVDPHAQKTDSSMQNRNLLLSEEAEIDTKPQLEIHADDVKCAHGVSIGQLDDTALFYLQSRGLDAEAATRILIAGFAKAITENLQHIGCQKIAQRALANKLGMPEEATRVEGTL